MCRLHAPLTLPELGHLLPRAGLSIQLGALLVVYLSAKYKKTEQIILPLYLFGNLYGQLATARTSTSTGTSARQQQAASRAP